MNNTVVVEYMGIPHFSACCANCKWAYEDYRDREDCIQSALLDCLKYWKGFDPTKSENPNAFAYFTQVCKNGYAKQWKAIHKKTGLQDDEPLEFISLSTTGDGAIYSI